MVVIALDWMKTVAAFQYELQGLCADFYLAHDNYCCV